MSGSNPEKVVRSAVPVPDLSVIDAALRADLMRLKEAVQKVRPADLGRDLSRRSVQEGCRLLEACNDRHAAAMLRAAHPAVAANILAECNAVLAARVFALLPTDQQVAVFDAMQPAARGHIEGILSPDDKTKIDQIRSYDKNAVARLMTPQIWRADQNATVGEALAQLRAEQHTIEVAQNCYITENGKLVGVVPLRLIAITEPSLGVSAIMTHNPIALDEETHRDDASEIMQAHDFLSLPVIDKTGQLVGAIRVDDLLDIALEKVSAGILNQGAVTGKAAARLPYFQTSLLSVVRNRITWLVLLFVAETATGTVLRYFENELAKVVALSFFIPLLIGTGGNAGSQTVSTIIRALALGEVRLRDFLRVLRKEVGAGVLLGVMLACIAFGRALLWGVGTDLAACVAITIIVVCIWANTVGALIPLAAQRMGIDPTVVSGPLITTLVDASGLFIYLSIAHVMIAQLH